MRVLFLPPEPAQHAWEYSLTQLPSTPAMLALRRIATDTKHAVLSDRSNGYIFHLPNAQRNALDRIYTGMERLIFWRPLNTVPSSSIALRRFVTQPPVSAVKMALLIVDATEKGVKGSWCVSHTTRIIEVQNENGVLVSDILRMSLAEEKKGIGNICWEMSECWIEGMLLLSREEEQLEEIMPSEKA